MKTNKNITQIEMADFIGESQQYVHLLINNKLTPRISKLEKFSKLTNTDLSFWLKSSGPEKEHVIKKAIFRNQFIKTQEFPTDLLNFEGINPRCQKQ